MTDTARRTYPRNDAGPRVVEPRNNRRAPEPSQSRRREATSVAFGLDVLGSRPPARVQTDNRINLNIRVTTRNPSQLRTVNPSGLIAVATLIDDRTGAQLPEGYLSGSRLMQSVGPAFDVAFDNLLIQKAGAYQLKVTLLRMPEASPAGGNAPHVAEWQSDTIRVQAPTNGA